MRLVTRQRTKLFALSTLIYSIMLFSGCSGGPGYVPPGVNNSTCSQNLSSDMKKLLGCPTQAAQQPTTPTVNLPPPIIIANGGTYASCSTIANTGPISVNITATDFQTKGAVAGATVAFFTSTSNTIGNAAPDFTATTGADGTVTVTLPTGTPFVAKASMSSYQDTYQFGDILSANQADTLFQVLIISSGTVSLVSALAHATQDWSNGAIAGTVWDCNGDPIENAIVSVVDVNTGKPVATNMIYFKTAAGLGDIPDPTLTMTSSDGIFVSLNTPPGDYYVVATGVLSASDTTTTVLGQSYAESIKNSVSISNIQPPSAP
ncbi:MAG: carboxypeptidase-like regulatory domain-containing protein [Deltaproteobacteria bacterium]|nr:carboxypeptidase-like regulatory domain-containing protein [Deltaproteobacteria bacterium]MCL5277750.1 carboxypeptidase-like regulatory domain-containing protein [Deltaproteobacteria bacterium]